MSENKVTITFETNDKKKTELLIDGEWVDITEDRKEDEQE